MHGTHSPHPSHCEPEIAGLNAPWKPDSIVTIERIFGAAGKTHAEIARSLDVPTEEFSAWMARFRGSMHARPGALPSLQHLMDLRKSGGRYPDIQPSDVHRRAAALERAAALARAMPDGWPNPPIEWKQEMKPAGDGRSGGWERERDETGTAVRSKRSPASGKVHAPQKKAATMKPRLVNDKHEPVEFPLTIAAARAREMDAWSLGDALVEEAGKPCASGKRGGGSYARIAEAQ